MKNIMQNNSFTKRYPIILTILGLIGFLAAFVLTLEKIELIKNSAYTPSCNINPILSCGSIMKTTQASAFGFPNALLGIAGFAVVVTVGVSLIAGAKYKKWFMNGLEIGSLLGVIFVHWLIFESLFVIKALCPYCMVVWTVTIPIFLYTTFYNLETKVIPTPNSLKSIINILQNHKLSTLLVWYGIIFGLVLYQFWYFWDSLI